MMKKKILAVIMAITLSLISIVPTMGAVGDNMGEDTFGLNVLFDDSESYYEINTGETKEFSITTWAGTSKLTNVTKVINVSSGGNASTFEFKDDDGEWKSVSTYNKRVVSKIANERNRKFRITFNKPGEYVITYTVYDSDNKVADTAEKTVKVVGQEIPTDSGTEQDTTVNDPSVGSTENATVPAKVKIKKVNTKNKAAKKVKLTLKKVKNAVGYEVAVYKTKKNAKKDKKAIVKKVVKKVKVTVKSKKLKNKKKLYVRVRAYVLDGTTKVYGKWSKIKKVKIK